MHDLVIRGGNLVDGTGSAPRQADVAIDGERIAAVGADVGAGAREIDATGCVVAPGWVDIHTHYDGQVTWDTHLTPSGWNGVTTVVMGNCGVGFAPVRPGKQQYLIQLMEVTRGNVAQTSKFAGKYRADLYALLKKHNVDPAEYRN